MISSNLHSLTGTKKLSPLELRVEDGFVKIIFPNPTKYVQLTPDQAESIGQKMLEFSRTASGKFIIQGLDA